MANGRYLLDETGAILTLESGHDADRGNLLGIQPWMTTADYVSRETFYDKLAEYLDVARSKGWLNARTVAVFPEYVGTWLVIAGEGQGVARAVLTQPRDDAACAEARCEVRFAFCSPPGSGTGSLPASLGCRRAARQAPIRRSSRGWPEPMV